MRTVDLKKVDLENACFHFTLSENLPSIFSNGLLPKVGENARGLEKQPKIYFAKGKDGAAEILNVWIRWLIVCRVQQPKYFQNLNSPQEWFEARRKFRDDAVSGKIFTEDAKKQAFEMFYSFTKNSSYLLLDLKDKEDYDSNDIDEVKLRNNPDFVAVMYGEITRNEENPFCLERWNMQTKAGKVVSPEKISVLSLNGKTDVLTLGKYIREQNEDKKYSLLDDFFEFVKVKEEQNNNTKNRVV